MTDEDEDYGSKPLKLTKKQINTTRSVIFSVKFPPLSINRRLKCDLVQ